MRQRPAVVLEAQQHKVVQVLDGPGVRALEQPPHSPGPVPVPGGPLRWRRSAAGASGLWSRAPTLQSGGVPLELGRVQHRGLVLQRVVWDDFGGAGGEAGDPPRRPAPEEREDGQELDGSHDDLIAHDDDDGLKDAEVPRRTGGGAETHLRGRMGRRGEAEADVGEGRGGGVGRGTPLPAND